MACISFVERTTTVRVRRVVWYTTAPAVMSNAQIRVILFFIFGQFVLQRYKNFEKRE